ncbi:MAG: FAD-linked oxidase [Flavobacteriaceae bacterium]|nr:FAD-linked oxidase [Flavobacteriaceae bacterium]
MATTKTTPRERWNTIHKNGPFPLKFFLSTKLVKRSMMPDPFARYNDAAGEMRRLLLVAANQNHGFRSIGARWSMSSIAHQKDRMHFTANLNIKFGIQPTDLHPNSSYQSDNIHFLQCGNTIKEISFYLERLGKSLKTTGASNGQTIAGCISTGVHGSALDVGSVQDYVVGLNLITGPNPQDIVYLERHTKPALNDAFAAKINARVIRNDGLFNAALVGLGSFGFIHGVVIEAEDHFLLSRHVIKVKKADALALADSMDFQNSPIKIPSEVDAQGNPLRPYHYKIYINQYSNADTLPVELMYKKPFDPNYIQKFGNPIPFMKEFVYRDLIYLLVKISEKFPKAIPKFIKALSNSILPDENKVIVGKLSEIFWDAGYQGKAFACSFGVDHTHSSKALKVLSDLTNNEGPVPGIFAMRFIPKSEGLISFAKFPFTCMVEIDGIIWEASDKLISLEKYAQRMIEVLQQHQIPFTIHWGKNADWEFPGLAQHMFGADAQNWMDYRSALLTPAMARVFTNQFLKDIRLDAYNPNADPNLISDLST